MKYPDLGMKIVAAILFVLVLTLIVAGQAPKARLSCEEITGGLYIANAQLAEQLRDTAAKLAEAQAELAKTHDAK